MPKQKQTVVSFRVDQHLAEVLDNLPDKSAFIREAILQRFYSVCPFCNGNGVLPRNIADWLQNSLPAHESVECTCCHYSYPIDLVPNNGDDGKRTRFTCPHCVDHNHSH